MAMSSSEKRRVSRILKRIEDTTKDGLAEIREILGDEDSDIETETARIQHHTPPRDPESGQFETKEEAGRVVASDEDEDENTDTDTNEEGDDTDTEDESSDETEEVEASTEGYDNDFKTQGSGRSNNGQGQVKDPKHDRRLTANEGRKPDGSPLHPNPNANRNRNRPGKPQGQQA